MKKVLLLTISLFVYNIILAQNYEIDAFNGQTINTCSGTFYDSGGPAGFYNNNENYTITFCPTTAGSAIRVDFNSFSLGSGDQLCVFNGINASSPLLGCFSNVVPASAAQASSTNSSGCLTFSFTSNNFDINSGWVGAISCQLPCQTVLSDLVSSSPVANPLIDGYIDICPGQQVNFVGQGLYPQNNTNYFQQDATSTFEWSIEGQTYSGTNVSYVFNNPGGYKVQLTITDSLGCKSTNLLNQRVRVSEDPTFAGTFPTNNTICIGDTLTLTGEVEPTIQTFAPPLSRGDSIFLPDGVGTCYQTTLTFNDFNPGQTLNNINDLIDICVTMEHSYLGDLNLSIECPNGSFVNLHQYSGGGGTFLGEPVDIDTDLSPGLGYSYCFTPTSTQTWTQAVNLGNTTLVNGNPTLPPGDYASSQSLTGLLGCPLNGTWEIEICDNLAIDNGYIFSWGIQLAPSVYPSLDSFAPAITAQQWNLNSNIVIANQGDTIVTIVPASPGTASYDFSVTNEFGCDYDTTIVVTVLPFTDPACFDCDTLQLATLVDTTICRGDSATLNATTTTNFDNLTYGFYGSSAIPTNSLLDIPIPVSGVGGTTVNANTIVSVCVDITHLAADDMDFWLVAPNGAVMELSTDNGSGGSNYTNTCFTPTALNSIVSGTPPFTGTFQPEGNWNTLLGSPINGTWLLRVSDDAVGFNGILNSAEITFTNPYNVNYVWNPTNGLSCSNCPNPNAAPDSTTTYNVTAVDNLGCTETSSVTVSVIQASASPVLTCNSSAATSVTASWASVVNTASYEVNINNGGWIPANGTLSHTVTGLLPSTTVQIQVRGIRSGICPLPSLVSTISCTSLACDLTVGLDSVQNVSCFGQNNGIAYVSATSSSASISYFYNSINNNTGIFNNLNAAVYQINVTDGFGCQDSIDVTITEPSDIVLSTAFTPVICNGENTGTATVTASGGVGNYTYQWNTTPIQTTATANNLSIGTYTVTVLDGSNCSKTTQVTITEPTALVISLDKEDAICYGANDGKAWTTVSGGIAPYNYSWNSTPIQTIDTAFNLIKGIYTITATDANNCIIIDSILVDEPDLLVISLDSTDVSCFHAMDGSVTSSVSGGTMPYNYAWNTTPVQDSIAIINLPGGSYALMVTDTNGCIANNSIIVNEPTEILASFSTTQVTCFGLSDGDATVFPTGGVGGYTYEWFTTPVQTTAQAVNLPANGTSLRITDSDGCSNIQTANVFGPVLVDIDSIFSTPSTCYEATNGSVGSFASGGTGNVSYDWSNGGSGNYQFNLLGGQYTLTITDFVGCQAIDSIEVIRPDSLTILFDQTNLLCYEDATGSATANVIGGTLPYLYNWTGIAGTNTNTISNLDAASYEIVITDAQNCIQRDTVILSQPSPLVASIQYDSVTCANDNDGKVFVTASGSVGDYSYIWTNNPNTTDTLFNVAGGIYTVIVSDSNNCQVTATETVFEPLLLMANTSSTPPFCTGDANGTAIIVPIGGNGSYSYQWNTTPTQTSDTAINLSGGNYAFTITDIKNCTYSDTVSVIDPLPLISSISGTNINCHQVMDGTATVTPSGGTAPYFYHWNTTTQTDSFVNSLDTGWHYVTVTDAANCISTDSVHLIEPLILGVTFTSTPVSCHGGNDGTATATVTGGVFPYSYLWQNGVITPIGTGLSAGWNMVTITDANNCILIDSVNISEPNPMDLTFTANEVDCYGNSTGTAQVIATGGVGNYTFQWNTNPVQTIFNPKNLPAGFHTVTVTDGNNCTIIDSVEVIQPTAPISISFVTNSPSCNGFSDGSATAITTGGTPGFGGYSYTWNTGQSSPTTSNIGAGTFTITVTDSRGCTFIDAVSVIEPTPITAVLSQQAASCYGENDAKAFITASGGTPDPNNQYTYLWGTIPVQQGQQAINLTGGQTYTVTITDENNCVLIKNITINHPMPLVALPSFTDALCNESADGTGTISPIGGTPPYQYQWDANANNQITQTATNLDVGIYNVTLTDFNNCTQDTFITISEPSSLVTSISSTDNLCKNANEGSITVLIAGGTPWYNYDWNDASLDDSSTIENLFAGIYTVTITDGNGCTIIETVTIDEPKDDISTVYNIDDVSCFGERDGQLQITAAGDYPPFEFSRDGVNYNNANIWNGLPAADYEVFVRDNLGCIFKDTINISQPAELTVDLGEDIWLTMGEKTPIVPTIQNGTIPYFYTWTPNDSALSCYNCPVPVIEKLQFDQEYTLLVTDANGCTGTDKVFVRVQKERIVYVATGFSPDGNGTNDFLYVQGNEQVKRVVLFEIYDRWGENVFKSEDHPLNEATLGWNGQFKNKAMNSGVFGWRLVVEFNDGETQQYEGSTTLIR